MTAKIGFICITFILLTGCGLKKFDCPYTDGVSCKSLSEVNAMVDRGEQGSQSSKNKIKKTKEDFINTQSLAFKTDFTSLETKEPHRVPEKILRIWLAPYESVDGTFHQQTFLNTVVTPAHWMEGG